MTKRVLVNKGQCELIALKIKPLCFRKNHFERPFLNFSSDSETKLRAFLFAVAICHQTYTLVDKKRNIVGWNCIEDVFTQLGKENSRLLDPKYLKNLSINGLVQELKIVFSFGEDVNNCTLDRLEERASFIIQIAKALIEKYNGGVENLLKKSDGFILREKNGLYSLLECFEAYKDPFKKKSTVFIQLAVNAGLFSPRDLDLIDPVVDYHMQRLMLRTGCIEVVDENLKKALQDRKKIKSDEDVRGATVEAIRILSKFSGKNFFDMDEILWSLGRSCCQEKTLCQNKVCNKRPCTFFDIVDIKEHNNCIFENVCLGRDSEDYRRYWQPMVDTHYY